MLESARSMIAWSSRFSFSDRWESRRRMLRSSLEAESSTCPDAATCGPILSRRRAPPMMIVRNRSIRVGAETAHVAQKEYALCAGLTCVLEHGLEGQVVVVDATKNPDSLEPSARRGHVAHVNPST